MDMLNNSLRNHPGKEHPTRVAIVDSSITKGELLMHCCQTAWDLEVVALENSGIAGLAAATRTKPDLVLVSAHLPDIAPEQFIRKLRSTVPAAKAILLTQQCSEYLIHQLSAANYHGVIWEMEEGIAALGHVIDRVRNGLRVVSDGIAQCHHQMRNAHDSFAKLLSNRHLEVLICITKFLSDEEIAAHLGMTASTALSHRQQIMRKLQIRRTPKLIQYGLEKGFGSVPLPQKRTKPIHA